MRRVRIGWTGILAGGLTLLIGVFLGGGCGSETSTTGPSETVPPAQVTDLAVASITDSSAVLTWTAVGGDGRTGSAAAYDIRYSLRPMIAWDKMARISGTAAPKPAGQQESFTIPGLTPGWKYYLSLKAGDSAGNWSERSNEVGWTTRPMPPVTQGFVLIDLTTPATFSMGSPAEEAGRAGDETMHSVTLTRSFWVSDHEVTQGEWEAVMGWNESEFPFPSLPVDKVSWLDAVDYCNRLSRRSGLVPVYSMTIRGRAAHHIVEADTSVTWDRTADGYRLLTEAEWEYVCRAGSATAFSNGDLTQTGCGPDLDPALAQEGWYCGNSVQSPRPVKTKVPNALGVYDMHGNVSEWCWDWFDILRDTPATDPTGPPAGIRVDTRVIRGGAYYMGPQKCRSASRVGSGPGAYFSGHGLRIARSRP